MKEEGYSIGKGVVYKLIILLKLRPHKVNTYNNIASSIDLLLFLKMYK
jgi:hypothetical protein